LGLVVLFRSHILRRGCKSGLHHAILFFLRFACIKSAMHALRGFLGRLGLLILRAGLILLALGVLRTLLIGRGRLILRTQSRCGRKQTQEENRVC
jgi:hypothetical protein